MARTPLTTAQRIAKVRAAVDALNIAAAAAESASAQTSTDPQAKLKLWEAVEAHGATVHRQARLLAGKSRGG